MLAKKKTKRKKTNIQSRHFKPVTSVTQRHVSERGAHSRCFK